MLQQDDLALLQECLPPLGALHESDLQTVRRAGSREETEKGGLLLSRGRECNGLVLVAQGQLRAFVELEDGKEITLYRLLPRDVCILTASCVLRNITFDVTLQAEKPSWILRIPATVWKTLADRYPAVREFSMELVAARFSEVMWVMEQMVSKNMGQRVAAFLLEQSVLEGTDSLAVTHETIARNLGTAREVVTRTLRYLQNEGLLEISRGCIRLKDLPGLRQLGG